MGAQIRDGAEEVHPSNTSSLAITGVVAGIGAVLTGRPGLAFPEQHRPDIMPPEVEEGGRPPESGRIDGDRRAPGGPSRAASRAAGAGRGVRPGVRKGEA